MPKRPCSPIFAISSRGISSRSSISLERGARTSSTNLRTLLWSSWMSSGRSSCTLKHLPHVGRDAHGAAGGVVEGDLYRRHLGAVQGVGAVDRVLERPRRVTDLTDAHLDIELVVEAQRRAIAHARLAHGEVDPLLDHVAPERS